MACHASPEAPANLPTTCITTLQGIALASDRSYKVLGAAYPWIARRLLTDTTPELRRCLRGRLELGWMSRGWLCVPDACQGPTCSPALALSPHHPPSPHHTHCSTLMALLYKDGAFNFRRMESLVSQAVRPTGRPQPRRGATPGSECDRRRCLGWLHELPLLPTCLLNACLNVSTPLPAPCLLPQAPPSAATRWRCYCRPRESL